MVPMSVPPGSPRQSAGGGKGGGAVNAPAGGGKGGGQAIQGQVPSPQPNMFGQGSLNTAIGAGPQAVPFPTMSYADRQPLPLGSSLQPANQAGMLPTSNLQRAIASGQVYMTPMPNPQQDLPSGFGINRGPSASPALPQGLIQRLSGFGGF